MNPETIKHIKRFCVREDLKTYDPFDMWKSPLGFHVKDLHHNHRRIGFLPTAALMLTDAFLNNGLRIGYRRQEYPIARAWAAMTLLRTYDQTQEQWALEAARGHLDWLVANSCPGYSGPCWGINFRYTVDKGLIYPVDMPLTTVTPYPLEAFQLYSKISGDNRYDSTMRGIYEFLCNDILVMEETDEYLITSYAAMRDRRVVNSVSYTMYAFCLLADYFDDLNTPELAQRIQKMYNFVAISQLDDGSWFYSPDSRSFIDCFHSCIVIKNLIKASRLVELPDVETAIDRGYRYLLDNFLVADAGLFKRHTVTFTPSLVRFDLYDNAEMLNLATLMGDKLTFDRTAAAVEQHFVRGTDVYSVIDRLGIRRNKNMLRWATLPYMYALSATPIPD